MDLYLVRHGQSESNARWELNSEDRFHYPDPGLTEIGIQQAAAAGKFLARSNPDADTHQYDAANRKGYGITRIYSSLMLRAVQTATIISQSLELPVHGRTDPHEWGGIYDWEVETDTHTGLPGKDRAYFETHFPDLILPADFNHKGWWNRPFEQRQDVSARARHVLEDLLANYGDTDERILLVTHGGFTNLFLANLIGLPVEQAQKNIDQNLWFVTNNTGITRLAFTPDFTGMLYINRTVHLSDELIT